MKSLSFLGSIRRSLPNRRAFARLLPFCLLPVWAGALCAQGVAVKYYSAQASSGGQLYNALVQASDGNFYGASAGGITRLDPEGEATSAYRFPALAADGTNAEGSHPVGGMVVGHDGNLYGLTTKGGALGLGTVYQFNPATGAVQAVASLNAAVQNFGQVPEYPGALVQDSTGNFFYLSATYTSTGTETSETEAIMKVTPAGSVSPLHVFTPPDADGKNPEGYGASSGLVIDAQDNLYGFTDGGGAGQLGTFYEVTPGGQATALYAYYTDGTGIDNTPRVPDDRANSVVPASDGTIYGAAYNLGATPVSGGPGVGTINGGGIFKAAGGQPEPLYIFSSGIFQEDGSYRNTDGVFPGGLTLGPDGNLYGITQGGGANGAGTLFQLTPAGGFKLLYTFPASVSVYAPPLLSTDGDLFGPCGSDLGAFYRLGATLLPVFNAPTLTLTATQGVPLSFQLVAANDPDTYAAVGLPAGLSLDADTGLITGATTAPLGAYPVALTATNADGSSTATLTVTVQAPVPVIEVPTAPLTATVNQPFSYQLDATNKPTSYQVAGLPSGVTYDPKTGLIHGLFGSAGKILLQIQAANAGGTGSASLEVDVAAALLPTVTLAATSDADAATVQIGTFTLTLSAASGADLIVNYAVKGSAVPGADYTLLKGTAKVKAGKTTKTIKVAPVGDLGGESKKTVVLVLEPGTGYVVGTTGKVKVKIFD